MPAVKLHVVAGKGGVGKTTIAAALSRALAARGRRTLALELEPTGALPALLLGPGRAAPPGAPPVDAGGGVHVLSLDGRAALEEYLTTDALAALAWRAVLPAIFSTRLYRRFVDVAPGLRALMALGKVRHETEREERGRPAWDAVALDLPATGHALDALRMPCAAEEAFGAGLVRTDSARIVRLLRDPTRTAVHIVTLGEELPVAEAIESHGEIVRDLRLPAAAVIVNRVRTRAFPRAAIAALERARSPLFSAVAAAAREETAWTALHRAEVARLRGALPGARVVEVPFLFAETIDDRCLETIARALDGEVAE